MHTLFSTILDYCVNNPNLPPHLVNSVIDILASLVVVLPDEGHQCLGSFVRRVSSSDRLFYLCQQGTLSATLFIQLCACLPTLTKRLSNYFCILYELISSPACISQEAFDKKWLDFRQTSFHCVDQILDSLQVDQILSLPELFHAVCQMLSNWYLLSHSDSIDSFGDDYFYEEAVKAQGTANTKLWGLWDAVTRRVRIPFSHLRQYKCFDVVLQCLDRLSAVQSVSDESAECVYCVVLRNRVYATILSTAYATCYDLLLYPSPSLPQLGQMGDSGEAYRAVFFQILSSLLKSVAGLYLVLPLAIRALPLPRTLPRQLAGVRPRSALH